MRPKFIRSLIRIRDVAAFLLIRGLFLLLITLHRAAFYRVLASVCEAKLRLCVIVQCYSLLIFKTFAK